MIGGWLLKVIVGIVVLGFLVIELGSPLVTRAQADDAAHEIANETAFRLGRTYTQQELERSCAEQEAKFDLEVTRCEVDPGRNVLISVRKEAHSWVLHRISALEDWYQVQASASSAVK